MFYGTGLGIIMSGILDGVNAWFCADEEMSELEQASFCVYEIAVVAGRTPIGDIETTRNYIHSAAESVQLS